MIPSPRDRRWIADMRVHADKALRFLGSGNVADLEANEEKLFAIIRAAELVGEGSAQVSEAFRKSQPHVPWRAAKLMRNMLIHAYREVDVDVVVRTVREDFPPLIAALDRLLGQGNDV